MNRPPAFSIITPTYNRRYSLGRVYDGLSQQAFSSFEWIIIDDGSTDGTCDLVNSWNAKFKIIYRYQDNNGKPSALNHGIAVATGRYHVFLDSDDIPVTDALAELYSELEATADDIGSVGVLTMSMSGVIVGSELDKPVEDMTILEAYSERGMKGDKWIVFKASVTKRFLFPKYGSEKFVPESLIFNRISRSGYKTRFINKPLLIHEYLPDGLSSSYLNLKYNNPIGYASYNIENISEKDARISKYYLTSAANIYANIILCSERPFISSVLLVLSLPIGVLKGLVDKVRFRFTSE